MKKKESTLSSMLNCRVRWEIDLCAASIEEAAKRTYALMKNAKRNAPCLTIWLGKKKVEYPVEK